ncbi:preprotein translocase subunit SecG [Candidatus Riesia pediculischaeffi]|uniref:preprotein translocase subunit SecG n=1 Tax=Candidatus Riesia pediculischaeffi TaxID=428411 RepID=UPI0009E4CC26|nr:preprotein translocase subunit SecG [Candidatus Riesia pediculischaeffi]
MFISFIFFLICMFLIFFIIVQPGKGGEIGSVKGSGASSTFFGSSGSGRFLNKSTVILSALFFIVSLMMNNIYSRISEEEENKWKNISSSNVKGIVKEREESRMNTLGEIPK